MGILPFLMQWLALSKYSPYQYDDQSNPNHPYFTPKSHWTLINEFADLPEEEIEMFLPQVCNIIIDSDVHDEYGIHQSLEREIIQKCAKSLPFGMKVNYLLKAASSGPSEGIFRNVLSSNIKEIKEARLRNFQAHVEAATFCGTDPSEKMRYLRSTYCQDFAFMVSSLARLGNELKHSPGNFISPIIFY